MDVFLRALYTGCSGYEIGYEGTKKSGKSEKQEPKPSQEDWKNKQDLKPVPGKKPGIFRPESLIEYPKTKNQVNNN